MQTIFRQLPYCAKPMERFSTAKDYYGSKLVRFIPVPGRHHLSPPTGPSVPRRMSLGGSASRSA